MQAKDDGSGYIHYTDTYRDIYDKRYLVMQYHFVQFFAEHLADVSRVFEGDLQSVLVLAIVGQMEIEARIRSNFTGEGTMPTEALVGKPPGINTSSIAEVSGIPRETVRRKLEGLAQRGWVERASSGLWHIRTDGSELTPAKRELFDIDRRGMERLCQFLGKMHALAVEAQTHSGADSLAKPRPPVWSVQRTEGRPRLVRAAG